MALSEKTIQGLNNISNATKEARLGDLLAKLEGKSGGGEIQKVVAEIRKELEDSNALVMEIEDGLKSEIDKIKSDISQLVNKLNDLAGSISSQLAEMNRKIEEAKSVKQEPVAPPIVSKRIEPEVNPIDEAPAGLA
jgi:predicted  nucleic acid-binding Zn-ribbon protein